MAELSIAFSPPSLKLRRALLAISVGPKPLAKADHSRPKGRGILAKESKLASMEHFLGEVKTRDGGEDAGTIKKGENLSLF